MKTTLKHITGESKLMRGYEYYLSKVAVGTPAIVIDSEKSEIVLDNVRNIIVLNNEITIATDSAIHTFEEESQCH